MQAFAGKMVLAFLVELGSSAVEGQQHILAGHVAGVLDGLHDDLQGFGMAAQVGGKAAFIADGGGVALLVEELFQGMENLGAATQSLAEGIGPHRHDHEFLDIQAVVGVFAAVDDVHHRHRHLHRAHAAEIAVERQAGLFGSSLGDRHRDGEDVDHRRRGDEDDGRGARAADRPHHRPGQRSFSIRQLSGGSVRRTDCP